MRRTYISPEFLNTNINGTMNMLEESNFFGAKMLEVEDSILIANENIIWHQMLNGEQFDVDTENSLEPTIFSSSEFKLQNHKISLDPTQTQYTKDNATRWIIDIKLSSILTEYVYAELKSNRTFEGVRSSMTIYNDINLAVRDYVKLNVLNRYKLSRIDFYVKYIELRKQNLLRFQNTWNSAVATDEYSNRKFQSLTDYTQENLRITFSQEKPSTQYRFEYFFNLFFEKI